MASKEYLAKYLSAEAAEEQLGVKKKKLRKKKKPKAAIHGASVAVHDADGDWKDSGHAAAADEEEDGPVVVHLDEDGNDRPRLRAGARSSWGAVGGSDSGSSSDDEPPRRGASGGRRRRSGSSSSSSSSSSSGPRRRRRRHDSGSSGSGSGSDAAPARRRAESSGSDASPARPGSRGGARSGSDSDADIRSRRPAAVRGGRQKAEAVVMSKNDADDASSRKRGEDKKPLIMSSGQSVGLLTTDVIKNQNAQIKAAEKEKYSSASSAELGGNAETVYRDKRGRRMQELEGFMKAGEGVAPPVDEEANMEWGKGLVQKKDSEIKAETIRQMADAPFARYAGDRHFDQLLIEIVISRMHGHDR